MIWVQFLVFIARLLTCLWPVPGLAVAAAIPVNALAKACRTADLNVTYRQLMVTGSLLPYSAG